jgi:hypothetical protein
VALVAAAVLATGLTAVGSGRAAALAPDQPVGCPVVVAGPSGNQYYPEEQYPAAGTPRSAAPVPYGIPFAGQMTDGTLTVGTGNANVLGPSKANLCGTFSLPSNTGTSTVDQLLITNNPVPVSIGQQGILGVQLFGAYIQLTATITSQIAPQAAPNGGLNLQLNASFAGTLVPNAAGLMQLPLQGFECTTLVGPIIFTTQTSGKLTGKPVTGPLDDASTELVANDFAYPAIDPSTPPVNSTPAPPAGGYCSEQGASLYNAAVPLPQPPGNATFVTDATFAVHATA